MIVLKTPQEIDIMDVNNRIVHEVLGELAGMAKPGVTTMDLERRAQALINKNAVVPAFLGYHGYPACLCASLNDEVVHGIPSERPLKDGDVLSLDFGVVREGFYGDAAVTVTVGKASPAARTLVQVTRESLDLAVDKARVGNRLGDVSAAIQTHVEKHNFSVIRDYVGHGIGRTLHEDPQVPNFGTAGTGPALKAGMVLAIEPMVSSGGWEISVKADKWTAVTKDGSLAAHFEYSVAITDNGPRVLGKERIH